jgi:host factor-I protein
MKNALNLQDIFLNDVRRDHISIVVFLISGYQIKGYVKGFDNYTIVLDSDGKQQMIYKHAISTIIPAKPVNFNKKVEAFKDSSESL